MEVIVLWLAAAAAGAGLAGYKNRRVGTWGAICLIAPVALLVLIFMTTLEEQQSAPKTKKCPDCAEQVQPDARVCRHCGHKFTTKGT